MGIVEAYTNGDNASMQRLCRDYPTSLEKL